jgi:hypothetical protein
VHALYDAVRLATRAPLLAPGRARAIALLAAGAYPVDPLPWRFPDAIWLDDGATDASVGPGGAGVRLPPGATAEIALSPGEWTAIGVRGGRERRLPLRGGALSAAEVDAVVVLPEGSETIRTIRTVRIEKTGGGRP